jgi:hypothetical protein
VTRAQRLLDANINPRTGLATDYLNHFNEAIMLLEMIPDIPECFEDFLDWQPMSYREHFAASGFKAKNLPSAPMIRVILRFVRNSTISPSP